MNDMRTERYCPADLSRDLDADIHPWLLSERAGGRGAKLSYVKVDILTDTLNRLFGHLGWGARAEIQKMEDFQYTKPGNNGYPAKEMYVFQVISQVTLTIKPQVDGGTETVFTQSGIGYGEVEINSHRKDAVGMAVKGAESDGLKRCCNFLGRALGMFLVGGKQDPVTYAHNGNTNQTVVKNARRDRDDYEDRQRARGRSDDRGGDRGERARDDRGPNDGRRPGSGDREEQAQRQNGDRQQGGGRQESDRQRGDRQPDHQQDGDRSQAGDRQQTDRQQGGERQREQHGEEDRQRSDRQPDRAAGDRDQKTGDDRERQDRSRQDQNGQEDGRQNADRDGSRQQDAGTTKSADDAKGGRADADKGRDDAENGGKPAPKVKNSRRANTNYDLRKAPVTREDQTDFGATFIKQIQTMRQPEDRTEQLKAYAQRINELDPDVRELVIERLKGQDMDVSMLD